MAVSEVHPHGRPLTNFTHALMLQPGPSANAGAAPPASFHTADHEYAVTHHAGASPCVTEGAKTAASASRSRNRNEEPQRVLDNRGHQLEPGHHSGACTPEDTSNHDDILANALPALVLLSASRPDHLPRGTYPP